MVERGPARTDGADDEGRRFAGQVFWERGFLIIECPSREERDRLTRYLEDNEVILRVNRDVGPGHREPRSDDPWIE